MQVIRICFFAPVSAAARDGPGRGGAGKSGNKWAKKRASEPGGAGACGGGRDGQSRNGAAGGELWSPPRQKHAYHGAPLKDVVTV